MAITMKVMRVLVVALVVAPVVYAADHFVGGNSGWTQGVDYDTWAQGQAFKAGDTLTFTYNSLHNVATLGGKSAYDNCNLVGAPVDSTSPTTVTLDKPGTTYYFACATPGHCAGGMKLAVTTASSSTPAPAPSTPATPLPSTPTTTPSPTPTETPTSTPTTAPTTPATTPAGQTPSSPNASKNGAAAGLVAGGKGLVVALGVVVALLG